VEVRCIKCDRLLTIITRGAKIEAEIKCNKCKHINKIKIDAVDKQNKKK